MLILIFRVETVELVPNGANITGDSVHIDILMKIILMYYLFVVCNVNKREYVTRIVSLRTTGAMNTFQKKS